MKAMLFAAMLVFPLAGTVWGQRGPENTSGQLCGPFSVYVIEKYYGLDPDLERIKQLANYSELEGGTSVLGMRKALEADGFEVETIKYDLGKVKPAQLEYPFVAFTKGHFVLALGVKEGRIILCEPPRGVFDLPFGAFLDEWSGVAINAKPKNGKGGRREVAAAVTQMPVAREPDPSLVKNGAVYIPSNRMDLGDVEAGQVLSGQFSIVNDSRDSVYIKNVQKNCSCTSVTLGSVALAPLSSTTLSFAIDTTSKNGPIQNFIRVTTDPSSPLIAFIKYSAKFCLDVRPTDYYIPMEDENDIAGERTIYITGTLAGRKLEVREVVPSCPAIRITSKIEGVEFGQGETLRLSFVMDRSIVSDTDLTEEGIDLYLKGAVQERVRVPIRIKRARRFEADGHAIAVTSTDRENRYPIVIRPLSNKSDLRPEDVSIRSRESLVEIESVERLPNRRLKVYVRVNKETLSKLKEGNASVAVIGDFELATTGSKETLPVVVTYYRL